MFKIAKNSLLNCSSKSLITGRGSNSFVYILVLWLWIVLFFSTFIFSLLPPQYGWWNYYGWQISEGAVLYKDLYCFLAPYYVWLSAFLYRIFGNNILVYYCIGICFDGIAAACVFKLLRRGVSPVWALTFTVAGAILQYSYLMYLPLDYNVFIADIVVIALYMIVIGLFDQKQRFLIYGGFLLGFASMMKQTLLLVAVISGATIFVVSRLIFSSQIGKKNLIKFSIGFIVSVGPGIIALVMTDTMGLLYSLIIEAGGSKGSITGIVYRFFSLGFPYGVFILSLVMALYLISPYTQFIKTTFLKKLNKMPYLKELLIFDLFLFEKNMLFIKL